MARPVVISCAVTGGTPAKVNEYVPVIPEQIANECIAAARAGAAVAHIHVRYPETGKPSMELRHYREVVDRIRDSKVDVLINLTTGPGAGFKPSDADPRVAAKECNITTPERRVEHVVVLKPDICSLDVATMNFGEGTLVNTPAHLRRMAELINAAGVKPELEVFDGGHIRLAADLIENGHIKSPALFQLCLGIPWGAPATPEAMMYMQRLLPAGSIWAGFGIARTEFPMVAQAILLGGHVRVGLEDNLYLAHGKPAPGNAALVERAVEIVRAIGEEPATPAEARKLLCL